MENKIVGWNELSKNIDENGLLKNFDWSKINDISEIDFSQIPEKHLIEIIDNYVSSKIKCDDNLQECQNVKKLTEIEKTVYCVHNYHLEQMNDGLMSIFTGYMGPLVYEIRDSLKLIKAKKDLSALNKAIKKININKKNEKDFLEDIENENLDHLYDEETEDKYEDYLSKLDDILNDIFWNNEKGYVEDLLNEYIKKYFGKK